MSTKLFIGTITFYILAMFICNVLEGSPMTTASNVQDIQDMQEHGVTTSTDTSGATATYVSSSTGFFGAIAKIVTFDYSLFYNIDASCTNEADCSLVDGRWQGETSTCKVANDLSWLRYLLMALGIVIIIEAIMVFRSIIPG